MLVITREDIEQPEGSKEPEDKPKETENQKKPKKTIDLF